MRSAIVGLVLVSAAFAPAADAAPKHKAKPTTEVPTAPAEHGPTSPSEVVGRYNVLRSGKNTGCMLTLEASRALLAPACRDGGMVIFDPKGWSLMHRRLVLRARKGHSAVFEMDDNGVWQKEAATGTQALGFRKM